MISVKPKTVLDFARDCTRRSIVSLCANSSFAFDFHILLMTAFKVMRSEGVITEKKGGDEHRSSEVHRVLGNRRVGFDHQLITLASPATAS
jgi:hypothetical protein